LQGLCNYYEISICNLHPNSVLLVACFIHLCEAWFPTPLRLFSPLVLVEEERRSRQLQCRWWVLSELARRDQVGVSTLPLEDHIRGLVQALVLHP
jgi:hypothetical protein